MPGAPAGVLPPSPLMSAADLDAGLDATERQALELGNTIFDAIDTRLAALTSTRNDLANTVEGSQESRLAALDATAGKVGGKVIKQLDRQLGQAYTYAFPLGITYPTNDQALYGLATGDYGGSMGLPYPVTGKGFAPAGSVLPNPTLVGGAGNDLVGGAGGAVAPTPTLAGGGGNDLVGGAGNRILPVPPVPDILPVVQPQPQPVPVPQPQPQPVPPLPVQPSPVSGSTTGPGNCPAGMYWMPDPNARGGYSCQFMVDQANASGVVLPACPPGSTWSTTGGQPAAPAASCDPGITGLWTHNYDPTWTRPVGGIFRGLPWIADDPFVYGLPAQQLCINGCHLRPSVQGQLRVLIPGSAQLYINPQNQQLMWAEAQPDATWLLAPTEPCNSVTPGVGTGGGPGGTGQCVPDPTAPPADVCPVFPQANCGPDLDMQVPKLRTDDDFCKLIADWVRQYQQNTADFARFVGMKTGKGENGWWGKQISKAVLGTEEPIIAGVVNRFAKWIQQLVKSTVDGVNCDPLTMAPIVIFRAAFEFIDKWTGVVPDQLKQVINQLSHYVCQVTLPSASEANRAYLADAITEGVWTCWVKTAGHHVPEAKVVRDGERHRPTEHMAQLLFRRKLIDQARYDQLVRGRGVVHDADKRDLFAWSAAFPSVGEAFKWAGEQLYDQDTVNRFELDDGFDQLAGSDLRDLIDGHGLDLKYAQKHWQAHWQRPGVGELIEMYRRLRPDQVAADTTFAEADLDAALKQHGFNDYWTRRLKAISQRVAQRRDVQRLYQYHIIDEQGMKDLLQDQGYQGDFADQLVESWKAQRKQLEYRANGGYPVSRMVTLYAQGLMSRAELRGLVEEVSYYPGQDGEILDNADQARTVEERRLAVAGLKAAFTKGLISVADAQAELAGKGLDADEIAELTAYWVRVKQSKPKQVPAATLCTWRSDGLIGQAEQFNALMQLGYTQHDARLIVEDCNLKNEQKTRKAEEAAMAKALKAAEKAQQAAEKAARNAKIRVRVKSPGPSPANGTAPGHP